MTRNDALLRLSARLIVRRNALLKALHDEIETFGNDSQSSAVGDSVDAAIDSANEEICSQLVAHESRELGQIEHALDRIARGAYGRCESCGGKIPAARLNALPYTSRCIDCQRNIERAGRSLVLAGETTPWATVDENRIEERQGDEQVELGGFRINFSSSRRWTVGHAADSRFG